LKSRIGALTGVILLALSTGVTAVTAQTARRPPVSRPAELPTTRHLLWIGAHPDDEVLVAPVLGLICVERRVPCTFLVATRGEAGHCLLPGGCGPDLGRVRALEVDISAALFDATLVQWSLSDGGGASGGVGWIAESGSEDALVDAFVEAIRASGADLVLTFDENHGSTYHADHRELGHLVRLAIQRMGVDAPRLLLLETILDLSTAGNDLVIGFHGASGSFAWDAERLLPSLGVPAWTLLLRQMKVHATQFDDRWLDGAEAVSPRERRVWWKPSD